VNQTIDLMNARFSTRSYDATPLSDEEKQTILHTTMRAPTAGNLMLYSIIEIDDQSLKDRLAETCDDQPFIARAPWVLLFVADYQKWMDLFAVSHLERLEHVAERDAPGVGDLLLACCDALIAAQNAVIAAESLGIGSCYIGDIMERAEEHAELLDLPHHTFPVTMVCFGRPKTKRPPTPHYEKHVVHRNAYQRLDEAGLRGVSDDLARLFAPNGYRPGIDNAGQDVYERKFGADFTIELNRSVERWIERWQTPEA
jgi:nitroreductase